MTQVTKVEASAEQLMDPDSAVWNEVAGEELSLRPTPVEYQVTQYVRNAWKDRRYGVVESAAIKAATNGEVLAIRLDWKDFEHPDAEFPDACAIAFGTSESTPLSTFGSHDHPMNMWYWRSDSPDRAEDDIAHGFRDISKREESQLSVSAKFSADSAEGGDGRSGKWSVIFTRPLSAANGGVELSEGREVRYVVLVWEGANEERAGIAAMTPDWKVLSLGS